MDARRYRSIFCRLWRGYARRGNFFARYNTRYKIRDTKIQDRRVLRVAAESNVLRRGGYQPPASPPSVAPTWGYPRVLPFFRSPVPHYSFFIIHHSLFICLRVGEAISLPPFPRSPLGRYKIQRYEIQDRFLFFVDFQPKTCEYLKVSQQTKNIKHLAFPWGKVSAKPTDEGHPIACRFVLSDISPTP